MKTSTSRLGPPHPFGPFTPAERAPRTGNGVQAGGLLRRSLDIPGDGADGKKGASVDLG